MTLMMLPRIKGITAAASSLHDLADEIQHFSPRPHFIGGFYFNMNDNNNNNQARKNLSNNPTHRRVILRLADVYKRTRLSLSNLSRH